MPTRNTCLRCRYRWRPRIDTRPVMCPRCKSRHWDEARPKEVPNAR